MANGSKLIWRGNPRCRSLATSTAAGVKFYVPGDEIPAGVLTSELEAAMVADGRIERVGAPAPAAVLPIPAPPVRIAPTAPHPLSVAVGFMEATLDAGPDGEFGSADDLLDIRPLLTLSPEPDPVAHNTAADAKPATAPVRAREGQGKKQKGKKR